MRTICLPNYSDIFMEKFEETYIYPYINSFSNFYCRFIDYIFFLWNGTNFKNSLRSSIIAILQLKSISNTLKPALNF